MTDREQQARGNAAELHRHVGGAAAGADYDHAAAGEGLRPFVAGAVQDLTSKAFGAGESGNVRFAVEAGADHHRVEALLGRRAICLGVMIGDAPAFAAGRGPDGLHLGGEADAG